MRNSPFDVRELVSAAIVWTSSSGVRQNSATDATSPSDAIARSGTIRYDSWPRRNSIDGIIPTSIAFSCSSDAHLDGASKRSANCDGFNSRPYTSGRAFRYATAPRRIALMSPGSVRPGLEAAVALDRLEAGRTDVVANLLHGAPAGAQQPRLHCRDAVDIVGAHGQRDLGQ